MAHAASGFSNSAFSRLISFCSSKSIASLGSSINKPMGCMCKEWVKRRRRRRRRRNERHQKLCSPYQVIRLIGYVRVIFLSPYIFYSQWHTFTILYTIFSNTVDLGLVLDGLGTICIPQCAHSLVVIVVRRAKIGNLDQ